MRACSAQMPLKEGHILLLRWWDLHSRRKSITHLGDANRAFEGGFTIGSAPGAKLRLEHESIAPQHAELRFHPTTSAIFALDEAVTTREDSKQAILNYDIDSNEELYHLATEKRHLIQTTQSQGKDLNQPHTRISPDGLLVFSWAVGRGSQPTPLVANFPEFLVGCYSLRFELIDPTHPSCCSLQPAEEVLEASSLTTRSPRLASLAEHRDFRVREQVARNPNTPPSSLRQLLREFPSEVLFNAMTEVAFLESPDFLQNLTESEARALAECELPEWFRRGLCAGFFVDQVKEEWPYGLGPKGERFYSNLSEAPLSELVAGYHYTAPSTFLALANSPHAQTRLALQRNPSVKALRLDVHV